MFPDKGLEVLLEGKQQATTFPILCFLFHDVSEVTVGYYCTILFSSASESTVICTVLTVSATTSRKCDHHEKEELDSRRLFPVVDIHTNRHTFETATSAGDVRRQWWSIWV